MEITPRELRDVEIAEAFRGYNREVVNDLLERAAASIDAADARTAELTERLKSAQLEADRSRETEDILHRTLLLAQRAADEAVAEAQQKSREMMEEAELESHKLLADAQTEAQRRRDEERERLETEVVDLAARRDTLLADVDALTQFESDYRARLAGALEDDLAKLRDRASALPGPVPQGHEVEMPVAREAFAAGDDDTGVEADPADLVGQGFAVAAPVDSVDDNVSIDDASNGDSPPEGAPGEQPVTDFFGGFEPAAEVASSPRADETLEVDTTTLFDAEAPAPSAPSVEPAFASEPSLAADAPSTDTGFDMLRPDALDAEVLDDDAFFATLREAVHDDSPLGPRDEGASEDDFYGDEGERASFRDVFRRRR
ncbi:MAG: DivIVA domain-containing protein [Acidimicrobiia bacterium]